MKNFFKEYGIKLIVNFFSAIAIIVIYLAINYQSHSFTSLLFYTNGFFSSGFIFICFAGLSLVNNMGGFDIFTYSFSYVFSKTHNTNLREYSENKDLTRSKKKKNYLPYLVIGILFVIIGVILQLFYTFPM